MKAIKLLPQKKWFFIIALLPWFLFSKCKKDEVLPEYYLRCKVNGLDFQPNGCTNCVQCNLLGDTTLIIRGNRDYETLGIVIEDHTMIKEGVYQLSGVVGRVGDYKNSTLPIDRYFTDSSHTGFWTITVLDKTKKIIQGTFNYMAFNKYRNDSITINYGKFRLKYNN